MQIYNPIKIEQRPRKERGRIGFHLIQWLRVGNSFTQTKCLTFGGNGIVVDNETQNLFLHYYVIIFLN